MLALITGATKGIGRAIVESLSKEGYDIIAISSSKENLETLKNEIELKYRNQCYVMEGDLTSSASKTQLIKNLTPHLENIHVLVNNFGKYSVGNLEDESSNSIQELFHANFLSAFEISHALIPFFKKKKKGYIFNILSVLAKEVRTTAAAYTISKHALKALNDLLREELRPYSIKVCAIYPGSVNTPSWDGISANRESMVQPNDIADFIKNSVAGSKHSFVEEITFRPLDPSL